MKPTCFRVTLAFAEPVDFYEAAAVRDALEALELKRLIYKTVQEALDAYRVLQPVRLRVDET
jgi:hypothetical protein